MLDQLIDEQAENVALFVSCSLLPFFMPVGFEEKTKVLAMLFKPIGCDLNFMTEKFFRERKTLFTHSGSYNENCLFNPSH